MDIQAILKHSKSQILTQFKKKKKKKKTVTPDKENPCSFQPSYKLYYHAATKNITGSHGGEWTFVFSQFTHPRKLLVLQTCLFKCVATAIGYLDLLL